jgi:hypothetical protein
MVVSVSNGLHLVSTSDDGMMVDAYVLTMMMVNAYVLTMMMVDAYVLTQQHTLLRLPYLSQAKSASNERATTMFDSTSYQARRVRQSCQ